MRKGMKLLPIKKIAVVSAGQGAPQGANNYIFQGGVPFVKAGNLEELVLGKNEFDIQQVSKDVAVSHKLKLQRAGSVLFAKSGMSCMKGHIYMLKNNCYVVNHLAILSPLSTIDSNYLAYTLRHHKPNTLVKDSAYPSISLKDIENYEIPVCSLIEQQSIVAELDKINEIIDLKKTQLKDLDLLAQSIFYGMFGDPIENPKGWEVVSFNSVGEFGRGVSKNRPRNAPELLGGTMPLIQTGEVTNSGMYITSYEQTYSELGVSQSKVWQPGTICITIAANIGKCSILTFEACFPDSVVGFVSNGKIENEYSYFVLCSLQEMLERNAPGAAQKNINLKVLNSLQIPLPPLSLQQSFAEKIQAIESQKSAIKQSLAEAETLLASRMDYWFG